MVSFNCMKSAFIAAFVTISGVSAQADTVNIDFSFDNTYYTPANGFNSDIAGTVTGEIFGLTEGGTSAATEILITSVPSGSGLFTGQYNLTNQEDNSFTLNSTGGVISADFIDYTLGILGLNFTTQNGALTGFAYLQKGPGGAADSVTVPGYGTVSFSLDTTAVTPLPASWVLMLGGLAGIGFLAYRRNAKASFTAA